MTLTHTIANASQSITIPHIPELFNPYFLDILIPAEQTGKTPVLAQDGHNNPMLDALRANANRTLTTNGAQAYKSTRSPTLNAFYSLSEQSKCPDINSKLTKSWEEDPELTLKIIWNLRSIHDGKSAKEAFYRAFGWLYKHHPRTAILNLDRLVLPLCKTPQTKPGEERPHGYWKDLLNILALATHDEFSQQKFLHCPKTPRLHRKLKSGGGIEPEVHNRENKTKAKAERAKKASEAHHVINKKLADPTFLALYIAVARLFAEQLSKDMAIAQSLPSDGDHITVLKRISLAAKWAPSPLRSHDRVTNISTAIALLLNHSRDTLSLAFPSAVSACPDSQNASEMLVLRSFYQRHILTFLRDVTDVPEPRMTSGRWSNIHYNRVSSRCMKNNTVQFCKHDLERFEQYLVSVEHNKSKISGATLLPHEYVAAAIQARLEITKTPRSQLKFPALRKAKVETAEMKLRVVEVQWKTLISRLRESGLLDNCIAICDVSGSMGSIGCPLKNNDVLPIYPAIGLSLVLAQLAKPPFNNCFITFSDTPEFVTLDPALGLVETIEEMEKSDWGFNTNLKAVFLDLILPLAVKHHIKNEDMIKRIFIFSDMQFDSAAGASNVEPPCGVETDKDSFEENSLCEVETAADSGNPASEWTTNHDVVENDSLDHASEWTTNLDVIKKAFRECGYDVPEIVYWDLAGGETTEVEDPERKGVAMMSGFSPGMMKVFMGEPEGETMNSVNVMMKALTMESFAGLRVVD